MKKLLLFLLLPIYLQSQNFKELDKSPMDQSTFSADKKIIAVIRYSRPQLKGRSFEQIVKLNKIWRTGANEANELRLFSDIKINKTIVPKGTYKIFSIPEENEITLIISSSTKVFGGARAYNPEKDVLRLKVPIRVVNESLEAFSIAFSEMGEQPKIYFGWEYLRFEIPFDVLP